MRDEFFNSGVELQVKNIVKAHIQANKASTMLDIGMNNGYFTLLAASLGAKVLAFEPQTLCRDIVTRLIASKYQFLRDRIAIYNVAIGKPGFVTIADDCSGGFGVGQVLNPFTNITKMPLDGILQSHTSFSVAKVDTEGAEVFILEELLRLAESKRLDGIVVEVMPGNWQNRGSTYESGLKVLKNLQSLAAQTLLLTDEDPFRFKYTESTHPICGKVFSAFSMADLIQDRLLWDKETPKTSPYGCNIWFNFASPI